MEQQRWASTARSCRSSGWGATTSRADRRGAGGRRRGRRARRGHHPLRQPRRSTAAARRRCSLGAALGPRRDDVVDRHEVREPARDEPTRPACSARPHPGGQGTTCAASAPTASTCTTSTSPTPTPRSRRRSRPSTSWSRPGRSCHVRQLQRVGRPDRGGGVGRLRQGLGAVHRHPDPPGTCWRDVEAEVVPAAAAASLGVVPYFRWPRGCFPASTAGASRSAGHPARRPASGSPGPPPTRPSAGFEAYEAFPPSAAAPSPTGRRLAPRPTDGDVGDHRRHQARADRRQTARPRPGR